MHIEIDPSELSAGSVLASSDGIGQSLVVRTSELLLRGTSDGETGQPSPQEYVLAGLAVSVLRVTVLVAHRHGIELGSIHVAVSQEVTELPSGEQSRTITREIVVGGAVSEEQAAALELAAAGCPTAKLLKGNVAIRDVVHRLKP